MGTPQTHVRVPLTCLFKQSCLKKFKTFCISQASQGSTNFFQWVVDCSTGAPSIDVTMCTSSLCTDCPGSVSPASLTAAEFAKYEARECAIETINGNPVSIQVDSSTPIAICSTASGNGVAGMSATFSGILVLLALVVLL